MSVRFDYNPHDPSFIANPYPLYARLRAEAPVYHAEELGLWIVSRYRDVAQVLHDPATFSSAQGIGPVKNEVISRPTMVTRDPPDHTRLRSIVSKAFTPKMVAQLEPRIRAITVELLDQAQALDGFDLIEKLAQPLPIRVIAEILGIGLDRFEDFKRWSDDLIAGMGGRPYTKARGRVRQSYEDFDRYFEREIEVRRHERRPDLLGSAASDERGIATTAIGG